MKRKSGRRYLTAQTEKVENNNDESEASIFQDQLMIQRKVLEKIIDPDMVKKFALDKYADEKGVK